MSESCEGFITSYELDPMAIETKAAAEIAIRAIVLSIMKIVGTTT